MNDNRTHPDARKTAEAARDDYAKESFLRHLFAGRLRPDLIDASVATRDVRPEIAEFLERFERFLVERVDPMKIDEDGEYPDDVVEGLAELGAFGMKIPVEYGGLGTAAREQWGTPIGEHQAIGAKLARMAATAFAMESVCDAVASIADDDELDIRMEAAAAKEWNTVRAWEVIDDALQIRARSQTRRGRASSGSPRRSTPSAGLRGRRRRGARRRRCPPRRPKRPAARAGGPGLRRRSPCRRPAIPNPTT